MVDNAPEVVDLEYAEPSKDGTFVEVSFQQKGGAAVETEDSYRPPVCSYAIQSCRDECRYKRSLIWVIQSVNENDCR
jgi:hypothetical protein